MADRTIPLSHGRHDDEDDDDDDADDDDDFLYDYWRDCEHTVFRINVKVDNKKDWIHTEDIIPAQGQHRYQCLRW